MKYLFALLCGTVTTLSYGQVTIKGKVLNYDRESIIYYHPTIEGMYTPYWEELKPKPNGSFTIQFENEGFGTTTVSFQSLVYRFFHDADSEIYLEIDQGRIRQPDKRPTKGKTAWGYEFSDSLKQIATSVLRGDYEQVNQYYNRNARTSYHTTRSVSGSYYSQLIYETDSPEEVNQVMDSLMQIELAQINQLPESIDLEDPEAGKKERDVKQFLRNEVQAFYGGIFLNGMFLKRAEQVTRLMKDSTAALNIYNPEWEQLIEDVSADMMESLRPITNSPDYNDFMSSLAYTMGAYQTYDFPQNPPPLDEQVIDRLFNYDTLLFSDEKAAFAYTLEGVQRFLMDQLFYSPALLLAIYDVQKQHPNSAHLAHYQPLIEKVENHLKTSEEPFSKGRIIRKNYASLDDLLSRFEGKPVLIDIWATWCHPCVEEFKHKDTIKPFIEGNQLELLYISIDKPEWEDRWKHSIKFNQLQGNHFRADDEFIINMWNTLGGYEGAIPRYALVNEQGEIVLLPRPDPVKTISWYNKSTTCWPSLRISGQEQAPRKLPEKERIAFHTLSSLITILRIDDGSHAGNARSLYSCSVMLLGDCRALVKSLGHAIGRLLRSCEITWSCYWEAAAL